MFYQLLRKLPESLKIPLRFIKSGIEALSCTVKAVYYTKTSGRKTVICCIANPYHVGGSELLFRLIAADLKAKGLLAIVITTGNISLGNQNPVITKIKKEGIHHIHLNIAIPSDGIPQPWTRYYLNFLLRQLHTPILHLFNPGCLFLIPPAQKAGMKIIYHEMGLPRENGWWAPLPRFIDYFDHVISVSKAGVERLQDQFQYHGEWTIIHSIIEPFHIRRQSGKMLDHPLNVIYFGNFFQDKGIHILVEAFGIVLKTYPEMKLTLIGEGPFWESIRELTHTLGFDKNINFLGFLDRMRLHEEMENADIFCLPSFSEGCPCSIIEAMSIGIPVVATDVGGIPELITDGETGLLVPLNNVEALSDAILRLAKNRDLRLKIGQCALQHYQRFHSREMALEKLAFVYAGLIKKI